ncbi:hypothetical protein Tco_0724914 [Tanacetum coccineum]|uniref:Uncharacterized protein n=1 Tax=Tanacetum coccineum TaxID=301880 RepID=A0ABQ4YDK3_9ASTR
MSVSLTRFSWWHWSNGKEKESKISSGSSSDSMKLSSFNKKDAKISSQKKVKKKWNSREERRKMMKIVDKEYDVVLVPSDGVCCLSASDDESSYDSDWSIGWMEPHAPDFYQSDDEQDVNDASFAVLVPCYRNDCKAFKMDDHPANNHFLNVMANGNFPPEGNKYMEQWIASLQNF